MADLRARTAAGASPPPALWERVWPRILPLLRYLRRNPALGFGIAVLVGLMLFVVLGYLLYDVQNYEPLSVKANRSPSLEYPLGTDRLGRDILSAMIAGTPLTLRIGLIAGAVGVGIGMVLGFVSAYYGGIVDGAIKFVVDVLLTIPGLLILILIATSIPAGTGLTVDQMALVVAIVAWLYPTRAIRAQVLVMRERGYVELARVSGMSGPEIIVREMMPNLMPYVAASFVTAVAGAILASIGLEALGLGPLSSPTLGMTIYWSISSSSFLHGQWWWFGSPVVIIVLLLVSLFMISMGLDEWANPRLRRRV